MYVERHLSAKEQLLRDMSAQGVRDARARLDAYEDRRKHNLQFFREDVQAIRARIRDYDDLIADQMKAAEPDLHVLGGLRDERSEQEKRLRDLLEGGAVLLTN
jgi:hypothetical protein